MTVSPLNLPWLSGLFFSSRIKSPLIEPASSSPLPYPTWMKKGLVYIAGDQGLEDGKGKWEKKNPPNQSKKNK
jgi:hypothetical protein